MGGEKIGNMWGESGCVRKGGEGFRDYTTVYVYMINEVKI